MVRLRRSIECLYGCVEKEASLCQNILETLIWEMHRNACQPETPAEAGMLAYCVTCYLEHNAVDFGLRQIPNLPPIMIVLFSFA